VSGDLRLGLDLVRTGTVRDALVAHGRRYLERVFTATEAADSLAGGRPSPRLLAMRFAAKEATLKVLQVDEEAVPWTDVEVALTAAGPPTLVLRGRAAELARRAGICSLSLALHGARDQAAALVVAEMRQAADS